MSNIQDTLKLDEVMRNKPEMFTVALPNATEEVPIRDLTDAQLIDCSKDFGQQLVAAGQRQIEVLTELGSIGQMFALLQYEMERRAKSIRIAHGIQ